MDKLDWPASERAAAAQFHTTMSETSTAKPRNIALPLFSTCGQSPSANGERSIRARPHAIENSWCGARTFYFSTQNKDVTRVTSILAAISEMTDA
jgi:hypothetical protein